MKKKDIKVLEQLEAIGQENEHEGIKATKHFMDEFDKKKQEEDLVRINSLSKSVTRKTYHFNLATILDAEAKFMDIPLSFKASAYPTEEGVVLELKDSLGRKYVKAFKPLGEPVKDYNYLINMLSALQDTSDSIESGNMKTKSGLYLP